MIARWVVGAVLWCWRHWVAVTVMAVLATALFGWVAAAHLGIDTDEETLLSADLPFRQAGAQMAAAFPEADDQMVVVLEAPSPAQAEAAANLLLPRLLARPDLFISARRPPGTAFFHAQGLLYLSVDELQALSDRLTEAQPILGGLARDPSPRGVLGALDLMLEGLARNQMPVETIAPALKRFADTAASVAAGKPKPLDWSELMGSGTPMAQPMAMILANPHRDFSDLTPGKPATEAIRAAAAELGFTPANGYRVRMTGSVPLTDDNFSTVADGVELSTPLSLIAIVVILFGAVRSKRLVTIILATLITGLAATAAFAAVTVKTLNPISVAFAVMFVGIAVDFAIQFVIRFRDAGTKSTDSDAAMESCATTIITPLSLAAAATAVGFLSFVPTKYVGVSQLGLVAGGGMLIALLVDLTLLPALLRLARPKAATEAVGMPLARPIDAFLARYPVQVVAVAGLLALVGIGLTPLLRFDFNPLHLQNPKAEAVATLMDLANNPDTSPYSITMLAPSLDEAKATADRLEALPGIDHAITMASFVPDKQDDKLAILADLASIYGPVLDPAARLAPPSAAEIEAAMVTSAAKLRLMKSDPDGQGHRLADQLDAIRAGGPERIDTLGKALLGGIGENLAMLSTLFAAKPVALADLPDELVNDWKSRDGRYKISIAPKGDMGDEAALKKFVRTVQSVNSVCTGMPIDVVEAGGAVIGSFMQAGITAVIAIALLLGLMLRRVLDAALVVLPLVLGGLYTVIGCVALGLAINFANIIALPLLLGIGVAFNIYFVANWRNGIQDHLQTSTCRAVLFSALTTSSAFGSLAVSPHVGTASMGLLLFLSVALSVATTFLVLPAIFHLLNRRTNP